MSYWKNRTVLVTGGAGFIGSHLVAQLVQLEAKVRIGDDLERGKLENVRCPDGGIDVRIEDLRDPQACRRICSGVEVVFHLASRVGGINYYLTRPAEVLLDNTLIDTNVLRASIDAGVGRYLYASSAHVYPIELQTSPDAPAIRENQAIPAHPELSYGWAKLLGEKQVEAVIAQGTNLRAAVVRIIGAYGPNQDLDLATGSAIPVFIRRAVEHSAEKPFCVLGTGVETRSYCYIGDIVNGIVVAVEKLETYPLVGPLNLGSEDRISIRDLAMEIIRISRKRIEITFDPSHPTAIWGQALDCAKARDVLDGWHAAVSLRDGLERCYAHIENQLRQSVASRER